ncbi:MAG TPA: hypothetical protein VN285_10775 [Candidatus Deferrimicrobium sp.]|nr:hypothetical protein [Candidatus Deferrimicrobium sp.]
MNVYCDDSDYAAELGLATQPWQAVVAASAEEEIRPLISGLFRSDQLLRSGIGTKSFWKYLLAVKTASESQFDALIRISQSESSLPNGILTLAGSGSRLHGFKNRPWVALPGNIHLCAFFAPRQRVDHFAVGFTILAAVSVIEAIDAIEGFHGKASIKWVNDVLIDNAKVAGVIAHTQSQGDVVTSAVIGIGLNVESTPDVPRDPFVPRVASLKDFAPNRIACTQRTVLPRLLERLEENYGLLAQGQYGKLLNVYRRRSDIIGREVCIYGEDATSYDQPIASGRVESIGENLELYLSGHRSPIKTGRLVLRDS